MRRVILALFLVGCAPQKSAEKRAATADKAAPREPAAVTSAPPSPEPGGPPKGGEGGGPASGGMVGGAPPPPDETRKESDSDREKAAKEAARSQGLLGPSDQQAFTPLADYSVKLAAATLKGGDAKLVDEAAKGQINAIQACYQKAAAPKPDLAGKLTVTFTVDKTGALGNVKITGSTLKHPDLEKCVVEVFQSVKLAKAGAAASGQLKIELIKK